jgi:hypothetical protein
MNLIFSEDSKPENFCLTIERLNLTEDISNESINTTQAQSSDNIISNHLEKYLKIVCQHIMQNEKNLFGSSDQIKVNIVKIAYPIILVFGILGNLISLIIMIKIYRRKNSLNRFSINLAALSLADLAVLIFGCFREYSDDVFEWRLRSINVFFCKSFYFNCYLFSCFSSYIQAFISIERWYAISNPIKSKINSFKNKKNIIILFLICFVVSLPYVYIAQLKKMVRVNEANLMDVQITSLCEIVQESFLTDLILAINDYIICCVIPFILAFTFSSLTLLQLLKNNRLKVDTNLTKNNTENLEMTNQNVNSKNNKDDESVNESLLINNNLDEPDNKLDSDSTKLKAYSRITSQHSHLQRINSNSASNLKLTLMLMTLPVCYVLTNFPIFIILIAQFYNFSSHNKASEFKVELAVAKVLMYTNNSINIMFYLFLGKSFKKVFVDLICKSFNFKCIRK